MDGSVATFYSYKGGVGRSFALANVAVILAEWGCKVLIVDWDIEAPGLNHYFSPFLRELRYGVLDFIDDCQKNRAIHAEKYMSRVGISSLAGELYLMPASGDTDLDYTALVQALDWDQLYRKHLLGTRLEALRTEWLAKFDIILIDSRTGVTDFSGLTTAQLPDMLVFMFTANEQSLNGCTDIARRAMEARRKIPVDRPALLPLPVPARFEQREEYDRAKVWRERILQEVKPFLDVWVPAQVDPLKLMDLLTIPYVPRWTFGEDLAALMENSGSSGTRTPAQAASYACETIAAVLIQGFSNSDLLVSSRDEYIYAARSLVQQRLSKAEGKSRIFVSFSNRDPREASFVRSMVKELERSFGSLSTIYWDAQELSDSEDWAGQLRIEIERSDAYIMVMSSASKKSSFQQEVETERVMRESLRSSRKKPIIPVILSGAEDLFHGSRLADYNAIFINLGIDPRGQIQSLISRLRRILD